MMAYTLRTTEQDELLISELRDSLEIKTVNKLFIYLLNEYKSTQKHILYLESNLGDSHRDLINSVNTIHNFKETFESLMSFNVDSLDSDIFKGSDFSSDNFFSK